VAHGAKEPTSAAETHAGQHGTKSYFIVWLMLMALTVLTVVTGRMDLGAVNIWLAMGIAVTKATLVVLFFMHMLEAAGANRLVFVVSFVFLGVMIIGVFGDLWTRHPMSLPVNTPALGGPEWDAIDTVGTHPPAPGHH
jgi:caa(3)-type oxidase subunit IV